MGSPTATESPNLLDGTQASQRKSGTQSAKSAHINAMSVDVEDYFQVWALSEKIDRTKWDRFPLRVERTTARLLDLMDQSDVKATFFTLAWIAQRCPGMIKEIVARGHELASHGMDHTKAFDQTPKLFAQDVRDSKQILEDIAQQPVIGYRAAGFSIDDRTPWAHETLAAAGYLYSSSLHPIAHDHYNMPDAPQSPFHPIANAQFREIPVATIDAFGRRLSCAGGGWFRALPYDWSRFLLRRLNEVESRSAVFYFHPWEIDAQQPRISGLSTKSRFRHYINLGRMERKLSRLFADFRWDSIGAVFLQGQEC